MIYLSELVFAALSGWLLAGESLGAKEVAGGALIMVASLLSAWLARETRTDRYWCMIKRLMRGKKARNDFGDNSAITTRRNSNKAQ